MAIYPILIFCQHVLWRQQDEVTRCKRQVVFFGTPKSPLVVEFNARHRYRSTHSLSNMPLGKGLREFQQVLLDQIRSEVAYVVSPHAFAYKADFFKMAALRDLFVAEVAKDDIQVRVE